MVLNTSLENKSRYNLRVIEVVSYFPLLEQIKLLALIILYY